MAEKNAKAEKKTHAKKNIIIEYVPTIIVKHRWYSGKIISSHVINHGSIPSRCNLVSAQQNFFPAHTYLPLETNCHSMELICVANEGISRLASGKQKGAHKLQETSSIIGK